MRNFFVLFFIILTFLNPAYANEKSDALSFFDTFVKLSNDYNLDVLKMYSKNPIIKRCVLRKKPIVVNVPFSELVKMQKVFNKHKKQLKNTKNMYNNRTVESLGNHRYKISAKRCPTVMNKCFNSYMILNKKNNSFEIEEEFSEVQTTYFLKFKEK